MATTLISVASGATSAAFPIYQGQNLTAGPSVQGGSVTISVSPTQNGTFTTVAGGASTSAISYRPLVNQWATVTATTQAGVAYLSDIANQFGTWVNAQSPIDSPNTTSEVALYTFRIPPNVLPANFSIDIDGTLNLSNNVNVKTLTCRMGGIAGTSFFTSPSLASNATYNFRAGFVGIGDGATLKGVTSGATGGLGLTTTAVTTLSTAYLTTETEIVITATKATGTDTMRLDSLIVTLN